MCGLGVWVTSLSIDVRVSALVCLAVGLGKFLRSGFSALAHVLLVAWDGALDVKGA